MDITSSNIRVRALIMWRNVLMAGVFLSFLVNLGLILLLITKDHEVYVVPLDLSGREYQISEGKVNAAYLEDMAMNMIYGLLNVTPESANAVKEGILKHTHPEFYGEFNRYFVEWADLIYTRRLATAFYPQKIRGDAERLTVLVSGILKSYVGAKQVNQEEVAYKMTFDYTGLRLLLTRFEETKKEKVDGFIPG